jgi:hypothetical protein
MKKLFIVSCLLTGLCGSLFPQALRTASAAREEPEQIREQRMQWWREARFGMFIT